MRTVVIYGRDGCHLCADALAALLRVRHRHDFRLEQVDVESDDVLHRTYLERIPVVTIDGVEIFQYFVDEAELERHVLGPVT